MTDGIQEVREVLERIGSDIADLPDGVMLQHAAHALEKVRQGVDPVLKVWQPRNVDNLSEALRALADIAEIGEERVAAEQAE